VPNSVSTCNGQGQCDFSCNAGYNKSGNTCACASACCSDADCSGGQTCQGGTCQGGSGSCDQAVCIALCALQSKLGLCVGNNCTCL
jgi:hypothetical protein